MTAWEIKERIRRHRNYLKVNQVQEIADRKESNIEARVFLDERYGPTINEAMYRRGYFGDDDLESGEEEGEAIAVVNAAVNSSINAALVQEESSSDEEEEEEVGKKLPIIRKLIRKKVVERSISSEEEVEEAPVVKKPKSSKRVVQEKKVQSDSEVEVEKPAKRGAVDIPVSKVAKQIQSKTIVKVVSPAKKLSAKVASEAKEVSKAIQVEKRKTNNPFGQGKPKNVAVNNPESSERDEVEEEIVQQKAKKPVTGKGSRR